MVTTRRPPPPSPSGLVEAPSSKAKDYSGRPLEVTSELDELRNRGIAKGLNKHFTDTTKRLAKEKAAADAALADLERRRANKSEFVPSRGGELNPFDSMYVELQQKRAECRRKEKETMLLYQRYVHKYGKKAKVAAPGKEDLSKDASSGAARTPKTVNASQSKETPAKPLSPPESPTKSPLKPLEENSESAVDEDVNFSKFYNKQLTDRGRDAPADPPADPPGMFTPDPPTDNAVSEVPVEIPDLNDITPHTSQETETTSSKQEEKTTTTSYSKKSADEKSSKPDPEEGTGFNGSRQSDSSDESGTRPTALVTTEMPSATTATDDDDTDDRSVISGLTTANSVYTRQVMDEIETEMEDFLKTETLAVQQMLDSEEDKSMRSNLNRSYSAASVFGDESVRVAMKAEAMAREMQKILDDFQKDDKSVSVQGESQSGIVTKEDEEASTATSQNYPRKFKPSIPGEDWVVYFDEKNQREYYHEKKSNRTQWHPPTQARVRDQIQEPQDYMSPRRTSRKELYRRRLRKRRVRRMVMFSFVALCGVATYVHWQINHPQLTYPEAMKETLSDIKNYDWEGAATAVKDKFEYTFTDRLEREQTQKERERKEKIEREAKAKREEERKAREKAEREEKLRQEKLMKEKEEALRREKEEKLAEQKRREEEIAKAEALKKEREEAERKEREAEERSAMSTKKEKRRPWGCNIPLAHIVRPRCRKAVKEDPILKEDELMEFML